MSQHSNMTHKKMPLEYRGEYRGLMISAWTTHSDDHGLAGQHREPYRLSGY
ncbi:hypothetical protein [Vibrio mediterranei]|uniref:hypothetical protein n=1 Tax=Vibrio mediterranei TaxID=689 RepID=UPI001EFD04FA|nr:hypothetical protein [Vibrio mediterranei]MCG9660909.1 hypothetical protein [Vibrio mediterranei]